MAHNITSPLSPCEGMIKDLSLDAIQLCERDGKERFFFFPSGTFAQKNVRRIGPLQRRAKHSCFVFGLSCVLLNPYCAFERE